MMTVAQNRERHAYLIRRASIMAISGFLLVSSWESDAFAAEGDPCGCTATSPRKQKRIRIIGGDEICRATLQTCTMVLPANLASQMASGTWTSVIGINSYNEKYLFYVDEESTHVGAG